MVLRLECFTRFNSAVLISITVFANSVLKFAKHARRVARRSVAWRNASRHVTNMPRVADEWHALRTKVIPDFSDSTPQELMLSTKPLNFNAVARMEPLGERKSGRIGHTRISPLAAPSGLRPTQLRNINE